MQKVASRVADQKILAEIAIQRIDARIPEKLVADLAIFLGDVNRRREGVQLVAAASAPQLLTKLRPGLARVAEEFIVAMTRDDVRAVIAVKLIDPRPAEHNVVVVTAQN